MLLAGALSHCMSAFWGSDLVCSWIDCALASLALTDHGQHPQLNTQPSLAPLSFFSSVNQPAGPCATL
jgi:hypothetical protein